MVPPMVWLDQLYAALAGFPTRLPGGLHWQMSVAFADGDAPCNQLPGAATPQRCVQLTSFGTLRCLVDDPAEGLGFNADFP